jgi:uncharacterized membrane protein YdjX (TVP38/TMEM64 family)
VIRPLLPTQAPSAVKPLQKRLGIVVSGFLALVGLLTLAAVLYFDRHNAISSWVVSLGPIGIVFSILIMAIFCMTPVPSEFLLLMDMRIYGVWSGIGIGWVGSILGSLAIFSVSRSFGRTLIGRFVAPGHLEAVEAWVVRWRLLGLLGARLLPIPSFAVNYALGVLRNVSFWHYLWTAGVTVIPYYVCTGLLYIGIFSRWTVWSIIGLLSLAAVWIFAYIGTRVLKEIRARKRNP